MIIPASPDRTVLRNKPFRSVIKLAPFFGCAISNTALKCEFNLTAQSRSKSKLNFYTTKFCCAKYNRLVKNFVAYAKNQLFIA
jgi:hypothetical protein